ncbi:hypothetical protein QBC32DRAFT_325581 [Pseudoneurospora amorphoporcata]|uniref:Uncharacterized protein n=1 Tax=Pseudoneurospora amorphoporcata TaxID=241081 RepID=A0AAN6NWG5_9PEZI|nr:hypothetical protein QBC32DRAFT_325581 [Pseudoneurospora amorphoporcata]
MNNSISLVEGLLNGLSRRPLARVRAYLKLNVTGGTGMINTGGKLVSFPGAYKATDPGILFQLYWPIPTSYINPGPSVVTC